MKLPARNSVGLRLAKDALTVAAVFVALGILVFPFLWVVLTSIRPQSEIFTDGFRLVSETVTLQNYQELFNSDFPLFIRNSLVVCLTATFLSVSISSLAAYSFSRRRFRLRNFLLALFAFSQLFPFIVLITPIYTIFVGLGLVNTYIGLIIVYIAITIPFSVYLLLGYLDSVPRSLDEAALIDGCTTVGAIFRVVLPVAWPGVATTAIYAFIVAWEEFLLALTLMTDRQLMTVPVGLAGFFGEYTTQWDLVMAASVIATLPTLVLFFIVQKKLASGLAAGSVKQ
jgi:ABC-type glycerol-3-phosphate transport system permease component